MKNVLVLLHDDEGQEARLQVALDLTRTLSGHLMCVDVIVPPAAMSDRFEAAGGAIMMQHVREREAENRAAVEARLKVEDVSWSLLERIGTPGRVLTETCDLADIIVLSIPGDSTDGELRRVTSEVAVKADRPVIGVPPACRGIDFQGPVLVGWNGSQESSEALRQAVLLLQHAASVTLLNVDHPAGNIAVEEAASYLSRHDVAAEIVTKRSEGRPISDVILDEARAIRASYLVMGAYGIPRFIEEFFGGVTAGVLLKSNLPLLLAR